MPDFLSKIKNKMASRGDEAAVEGPPFIPACFAGAGSLADNFQHETGAHGWGNAELQNYTDREHCSFMQPSDDASTHQLVLRAHADNATGRFESARLRSRFCLRDGPGGAARGFLVASITAPVASKNDLSALARTKNDDPSQRASGPRSGCSRPNRSPGRRTARSTSLRRGTGGARTDCASTGVSIMVKTTTSTASGR